MVVLIYAHSCTGSRDVLVFGMKLLINLYIFSCSAGTPNGIVVMERDVNKEGKALIVDNNVIASRCSHLIPDSRNDYLNSAALR